MNPKEIALASQIIQNILTRRQEIQAIPDFKNNIPYPLGLRRLSTTLYRQESSRTNYMFSRRLEEGETSYVNRLPKWKLSEGITNQEKQLTIVGVVEMLIFQREREAKLKAQASGENQETSYQKYYSPPVIWDVGYGNGQALLDAEEKWSNKVILVGYGSSLLTDFAGYIKKAKIDIQGPTRQKIKDKGIELVEGNIIDIKNRLKEESPPLPDVIWSCNVLQYVPYPQWELIKKLYRIVKPDGFVFIAMASPVAKPWGYYNPYVSNNSYDEYAGLQEYTQNEGYAFQITPEKGYIAFQRILHPSTKYEPPKNVRSSWPGYLDKEPYKQYIDQFGTFPAFSFPTLLKKTKNI